MPNRARLVVTAPAAGAATVNIYRADGTTPVAAYTTETGSSAISQPATVNAGTSTTFWVPDDEVAVVSATIASIEVAGGDRVRWTGTVSNDGVLLTLGYPIGSGGDWSTAQTFNAQTGTTYTLVAGDAGKIISLSNGSAITLTLPQDSDATISVGVYVDLYQLGAGQVTVVAGTGATLRISGLTAKARAQYSRLVVQKMSANTWLLAGDLAAS